MFFEIKVSLDPPPAELSRVIAESVEAEAERQFAAFLRRVPAEIRGVMNESSPAGELYARQSGEGFTRRHPASAKGQPPAKDTFELYNSLVTKKTGAFEGYLELADYAEFLDPVFDGYLDRPFIETAVDRAIIKAAPKAI